MSIIQGLSLFFLTLPTVSAVPSAHQGIQPAAPSLEETRLEASSEMHGSPALFAWADFDGDTRLDLAAVSAGGTLQLLANVGEGQFDDVTERVGLAGIANAALALWADYDGDLLLDIFVGAREGGSRLFHNEGGLFADMSAGSGLQVEGAVRSAHWLDEDGDGKLDLHVVTAEKHQLFRGLEGGFFEVTELPPIAPAVANGPSGMELGSPRSDVPPFPPGTSSDDGRSGDEPTSGNTTSAGGTPIGSASSARIPLAPPSPLTVDPSKLLGFPLACARSIRDQANPGSCIEASTTPTLGRLHPISANLFVAVSGEVGIGTTSPAARLHLAGTARIADTLTLAPSGDQALNVSTGSIYKGGALFIHTKGGVNNAAVGQQALLNVTTGRYNTAHGANALFNTTTGIFNTALGGNALYSNTTGSCNTAVGLNALLANINGSGNTATGCKALYSNSASGNTATGNEALFFNTTGRFNTASGFDALFSNTTGDRNTASGYDALFSNTTGYRNTASGFDALRSNTAG